MAVLVTGATGFLGSWLVRRLCERGENVRVFHRPNSSLAELQGLKFESRLGDVTDLPSLEAACKGVHTVFHLAGLIGYSRAKRAQMEMVNVGGTLNVLEVIKKSSPRIKLVYMSSVVAIGAAFRPEPLNEDSPYELSRLDLGYFETKRRAEAAVVEACRQGAVEAVILNPSTIYGPGDAKKGSRKTQIKVAHGRFPFYTSGGVSVVSIHDVVSATLTAWEKGRIGQRYILSGENLTLHDLFHRIAALGGAKPPYIYLPNPVVHLIGASGNLLERFGKKGALNSETAWTSILFHWFKHDLASRELDFKPRSAQEALTESVGWMRENRLLG